MANEIILIENDKSLEGITDSAVKLLNKGILKILPKGTISVEKTSTYKNYDRLGGQWGKSTCFDYLIDGNEVGFFAVGDVGYRQGLVNLSLPSEYLEKLVDYLRDNNRFWYGLLGSRAREAA